MEDCWEQDPAQRPHFASLLHTLRAMLLRLDCGNLIKLDRIDERNPYYGRPPTSGTLTNATTCHEKLHRSSATPPSPSSLDSTAVGSVKEGPGPTVRPTSIQVHPYPYPHDQHLPRISEEAEEEELEDEEGYSSGGGTEKANSDVRHSLASSQEGRWRQGDDTGEEGSIDSGGDSAGTEELCDPPAIRISH